MLSNSHTQTEGLGFNARRGSNTFIYFHVRNGGPFSLLFCNTFAQSQSYKTRKTTKAIEGLFLTISSIVFWYLFAGSEIALCKWRPRLEQRSPKAIYLTTYLYLLHDCMTAWLSVYSFDCMEFAFGKEEEDSWWLCGMTQCVFVWFHGIRFWQRSLRPVTFTRTLTMIVLLWPSKWLFDFDCQNGCTCVGRVLSGPFNFGACL